MGRATKRQAGRGVLLSSQSGVALFQGACGFEFQREKILFIPGLQAVSAEGKAGNRESGQSTRPQKVHPAQAVEV